ncbi:mitochondrial thiamine pyrophosphate transporter, partial [Clydaea vesicula]
FSGFVATSSTYPLDLLRTRFAVQKSDKKFYNKGILAAIRQIKAQEGVQGFYKGCVSAVLQRTISLGIVFSSHDYINNSIKSNFEDIIGQNGLSTLNFLTGGLSGMLAKAVTMPLDVIRKRMQVQGPSRSHSIVGNYLQEIPKDYNFFKTFLNIYKNEGPFALYKGLLPALLKAAPSTAVTLFVVGLCRNAFNEYNNKLQVKQ